MLNSLVSGFVKLNFPYIGLLYCTQYQNRKSTIVYNRSTSHKIFQRIKLGITQQRVILQTIVFSRCVETGSLGDTGIKISALSLGTAHNFSVSLDYDQSLKIVKKALELGINYIDTAEAYNFGECEKILGRIITELQIQRSSILIGTKIYYGGKDLLQVGLSRKHIHEGIKSSLKRLGLDYLDFVVAHKPPEASVSILEVVRSFTIEITNQKALYWGTCDWPANLITEAKHIAKEHKLIPPTFEQPQYNFLNREKLEKELFSLNSIKHYNLGIVCWGALGSGLLTGKYSLPIESEMNTNAPEFRLNRDDPVSRAMLNWVKSEEGRFKLSVLQEIKTIAKELNCTLAQLSIAWCLKQANCLVSSVVIGVSNIEQLKENYQSLVVYKQLTEEQCQRIDRILNNNKHIFTM